MAIEKLRKEKKEVRSLNLTSECDLEIKDRRVIYMNDILLHCPLHSSVWLISVRL